MPQNELSEGQTKAKAYVIFLKCNLNVTLM